MRPFRFLFPLASAVAVFASPVAHIEKRAISQSLMDEFKHYVQFASGAYQIICPAPLGTTMVKTFSITSTDTQGYIARDDSRKEIIVAFRGTLSIQDFITDFQVLLVDYASTGVSGTSGVKVHQGFITAFNSASDIVLSTVTSQLNAYPTYSLVVTGHSLGAALASLGAVSLKSNFPSTSLKLYTFGQPRTGNPDYASLAENVIGVDNIFRTTETYDGVVTVPFQSWGYQHHGTQYWVSKDPNTDPSNVVECVGREDPTCSDSIPSTFINDAHLRYFGQIIALNPLVCI